MSERTKRILFQFSFVLVACIIIEVILRFMGYKPGDIKPNWLNFHPVDTLKETDNFYVNKYGLVVANPEYDWPKQLGLLKINSDGFRSPEFEEHDSTKKKILFIGDSFTWGHSSEPIWDSSFTDILRNETNYEVVNTGIPTADPPQYLGVAKKYIPELKPDIVFVMFFLGNDLMKEDRKLTPDSLFFYFTNAGALQTDIDGKHFASAQSTYNYITLQKYYIGNTASVFEKIISKSSLLSRLYSIRFRVKEKIEYERIRKDTHITKKYLKEIKKVCEQNQVNFRIVLIVEIKEADMKVDEIKEKYANLLLDSDLAGNWMIPECQKQLFNDYPDGHLNNQGHRYYATYLKSYLNKEFKDN